eukprot:TRINITY_DN1983_c0_g1_i1.p1 TRINITY_DN1983_c0_g1~~TRINITY_DN1983_c0_g1_i1.p1  ORF type:complete len:407 (+),score=59.52 TRINITY_DN1983_c0_g1_i1:539-1759(+)
MVDKESGQLTSPTALKSPAAQPRKGFFSRIFGLFSRNTSNDFEKRLQHLSKEERAVHTRMKRRTRTWAKLARGLIVYPILVEVFLLALSIWTTRYPDLPWKTRATRVLPVFALPAIVTLIYSGLARYYRMRERKDQNTLERLRAERQAKIDELKEKTNYYAMQQLIQQYDSDPAAKAAAATILASKIGVDSGLKLALQHPEEENQSDSKKSPGLSKGRGSESTDHPALRKRRVSKMDESTSDRPFGERNGREYGGSTGYYSQSFGDEIMDDREMQRNRERGISGGWIARFAAMLVGEDPTQCYALICKNCHMHNGLATKEDFPYVTYHCRYCSALNGRPPQEAIGGVGPLDGPSGPLEETSPMARDQSQRGSMQSGSGDFGDDVDTARTSELRTADCIADVVETVQ